MNLKTVYRKNEHRRVERGGCWDYSASYLRAASRYDDGPSVQDYSIGARLSRSLGDKDEVTSSL